MSMTSSSSPGEIQNVNQKLLTTIGYKFTNEALFELALTHKSFANEAMFGGSTPVDDNERLEFLGDAVLDLALSEVLMKKFPMDSEGALSKKRASLVNEESLATVAVQIGLDQHVKLGKGEIKTGGLQKPRILASSLEALIGAVFQDSGYILVTNLVENLFAAQLKTLGEVDFSADFKTRLQERAQDIRKQTPTYRVESQSGPDHDKTFTVIVEVGTEALASGSGKSKKAAEQMAAKKALEMLT